VPLGLVFICLGFRPADLAADFFSATGSGIADVAYLMRSFNVADRLLDVSSHTSFGLLNQRITVPLGDHFQA
jgi:hypothetical protein